MKIFFIENSNVEYDSSDRFQNKLRGAETVLINLAENLSKLNNEVHIYNNCNHNKKKITQGEKMTQIIERLRIDVGS